MSKTPWHSHEIKALENLGLFGEGVTDDLRFPATSINPTGPGTAAGVSANTGHLTSPSTNDAVCSLTAQMPHEWKEGSPIEPHVHWYKADAGAGNVKWKIEYKMANVGDVFPGNDTTGWTELTAYEVIDVITGDQATAYRSMITTFGEVDMTGISISAQSWIHISRIPGDAEDDYAGTARLMEFDIHYLKDSNGSINPYNKNANTHFGTD